MKTTFFTLAVLSFASVALPLRAQLQEKRARGIAPAEKLSPLAQLLAEAEEGNAAAQLRLGLSYSKGEGVFSDHSEAARWYRAAAEQGLADAQFMLGVSLARGIGV